MVLIRSATVVFSVRVHVHGGKGLLVAWKGAVLSNCSVLVSREHGGPEGMDPDGVIEVRHGCGL